MTQKISPAVRASAARIASATRVLSDSEIIGLSSPAARGAAAPEGAAAAAEGTATVATTATEGAAPRRAASSGKEHQDEKLQNSPANGATPDGAKDQKPDTHENCDDGGPNRPIGGLLHVDRGNSMGGH